MHIEKIIGLQPDLIIANNEENVKEQVEALAEKFPVWVTDVKTLDEAINMIKDIGLLVGKTGEAANLELAIRNAFDDLNKTVNNTARRVRTTYLIWKEPYMTVGGDTFINDMMKHSGLQNIFEDSNRYPELEMQQLKKMNCELVLLSSEPYPFKEKHIEALQAELRGTKILLVDGEMFSWYGSRLLEAASYFKDLRESIYK